MFQCLKQVKKLLVVPPYFFFLVYQELKTNIIHMFSFGIFYRSGKLYFIPIIARTHKFFLYVPIISKYKLWNIRSTVLPFCTINSCFLLNRKNLLRILRGTNNNHKSKAISCEIFGFLIIWQTLFWYNINLIFVKSAAIIVTKLLSFTMFHQSRGKRRALSRRRFYFKQSTTHIENFIFYRGGPGVVLISTRLPWGLCSPN